MLHTAGSLDGAINALAFDSRVVNANTLFVAISGTQTDGHRFIETAVKKGATAIVAEVLPTTLHASVTYIQVANSSEALGQMAANFYDHPSKQLKLVGVTGTNGKTTIATLLYTLFQELGYPTGLLSTVQNRIGQSHLEATHTTPDAIAINRLLAEMVEQGCSHCFMEVSSHAVDQNRIAGLHFSGGIFINLTHDHLDYHKTFAAYLKAKKSFFDQLPANAFALSNIDDKNGRVMQQNTKAKKCAYGLKNLADYKASILENQAEGLLLQLNQESIWFRLVGEFNAYNLLAVYGAAIELGENREEILPILSALPPAEGRFEVITAADNRIAIIDYAHTPDALKNVLQTIQQIQQGDKKVLAVVGAGGNRDKSKRPEMAQIAAQLSDQLILTSDNPRFEEPSEILREMENGLDVITRRKALTIENRKEAIKTACALAQAGDIILVAGKGHEKYQDIKGVKHPFDDKAVVKEFLEITD